MDDWLDTSPVLRQLRHDSRLAEYDISWLQSSQESDAHRDSLIETYADSTVSMGVLWIDGLWEASSEDAYHRRLIAHGPVTRRRDIHEAQGGLYIDERYPDRVFYTPETDIPPPLWLEVEPDAERLAALLAEYHPRTTPRRLSLQATQRAFAGRLSHLYVPSPYSGALEHAGPHEIGRHMVFSPFAEALCWGSAYDDDPWPPRPDGISTFQQMVLARSFERQAAGAVCMRTRRTVFSRSQVGLEFHGGGRYVWEARYQPSAFPATLHCFNSRFGTRFAEHMPVDVAGMMLGFAYLPRAAVLEELDAWEQAADPTGVAYWLNNLAALECQQLDSRPRFLQYGQSRHDEIRAAVINRSLEYNWRSVLETMAFGEREPRFVDFLYDRLRGFGPPAVNEFGEPLDLWAEVADDDDAEEDDE